MAADPTSDSAARPRSGGSGWGAEGIGARVVLLLPAAVALARLAGRPSWREDAVVLRDVALVATGPGGGVSTALTQVAGVLPLGTLSFRAALVSVVALAIASRVAFSLALRLLRATGRAEGQTSSSWLAPAFATIAVCGAAMSPSVQLEATVAGGATTAAALVLGALALAARAADAGEETARGRDLAAAGLLAGAALAERPLAAAAALASVTALLFTHRLGARLAARWAGWRKLPVPSARVAAIPPRAARLALVGFVVAAAGAALPAALRPLAPHRALDLGWATLPGGGAATVVSTALTAWVGELGWTPLGLAALGMLVLAARAATRPGAAALAVIVVLDVPIQAPLASGTAIEPAAALRMLAVIALALLAAVGLHEGVARLLRARVPYARPAAVLLVAFQATVVALASEQASEVADRTVQRGPEEWLDASRGALEARSLVLVARPHKATRLWAAQLTAGWRPDVLVVATELLPRGGVAADLLAREPRAHDLVRTTALKGAADEFALSEVADARALHVEPDRTWDERTASHVELDGLWLRFAAQPIGRTDRRRSAADSVAPVARVLDALGPTEAPDPATSEAVVATLREQALVVARLGETETARALARAARGLNAPATLGSPAATMLLAALEATAPPPGSDPAGGSRPPTASKTYVSAPRAR